VIDLTEGAFSSGQTYVALSRCTSLEGITLHTRLSQRDIIVNNAVVNFSRKFNDNLLITKALDNAQADALYLEALESFHKVDIPDAVTKLAKATTLRNDLEKPSIQRFISSKLNIINKQKSEIVRLNGVLSDLAKEYIDMGGECLNIEGASEAAIANFEKALRLDPNNQDAMYGKSLALLDMGKYNESLNNLLILFKINARHYQARCLQGLCHFRLGSYDRALIAYNAALKIKRTDPDLHLRLAECFDAISLEDMADKHRELAKKYRSKKQK
jgi:tetratricopeptide (TPR) repeat protein